MDELHPLQSSIETVAAIAFAGLGLYLITELVIVHVRRRKLRLRETRMAALGVLSQGMAAGAVFRLWGPLTVAAAAIAGAMLTPFETGTSWLNRDGETGWVVPANDSAALAAAIRRLLEDPSQRRRMGERARARARAELDAEQMVERVIGVYEELLG